MIAVDTETEGLGFYDPAFCVSMTMRWGTGSPMIHKCFWLDDPIQKEAVRILLREQQPWIFHNAKFDLQKLILAGLIDPSMLTPYIFHDTQTLAYLLDEHEPLGLKKLAKKYLNAETDELEAINEAKKVLKKELGIKSIKDIGYHMLPREIVEPYALKDTEFTYRLYEYFLGQREFENTGLWPLYNMEKELILALLDIESRGMALDVPYLEEKELEYRKLAFRLEIQARDLAGNDDFNPGSPNQVREAFAGRGIDLADTRKETLGLLGDKLATALVELRSVRKMHGSYLCGLLAEQRNGLVHPNFNPARTKTGRMSSSGQID